MYYTYILYSLKGDKYNVGSTHDIDNRLVRHNRGDGSKFTKSGKPWQLYYSEEKSSRQEAVARELEIKRKKRDRTIFPSLYIIFITLNAKYKSLTASLKLFCNLWPLRCCISFVQAIFEAVVCSMLFLE